MCGIVSVLKLDGRPVDADVLIRMRDAMTYRGPDDCGIHVDGRVGLGHRRLSIQDLSPSGHQPMTNENGTIHLVFNGEIYNYPELTTRLKIRGHQFASTSDTEVILHLYEELGERCVEELSGMFSFVLWDARQQKLFAARDRLGIKPLLYYVDDSRIICASEAKAILEDPDVPRAADVQGLAGLLYSGFPLAGRTALRGISQLPPGHSLVVDERGMRISKYWDIAYSYARQRSAATTIAELREILEDAVRIHCRSDASLGCHLSGGLDSSTVTALAAKHRQPLKSFSIRFSEGGYYDETEYARALAAHAGTEYLEAVPGSSDFTALLPSLIRHVEMPLPNGGGFSYYTVSRLASEHVKVALTGHGGDEVFAGYPAQFQAALGATGMFGPPPPGRPTSPNRMSTRLRRALRERGPGAIIEGLRARASGRKPTLEETWIALHCGLAPQRNHLLHPAFVRSLNGYDPREEYLAELKLAPTAEPLDRCLYHDIRSYLPGLLYMEDRLSMAVSLESRVPLLDHRIVEYAATIPPEQKVAGLEPKAMLKRAAGPHLPASIRDRADKRAFVVPISDWYRNELQQFSRSVLNAPECLDRGVLSADQIRADALTPRETWVAVNVELWYRTFIDQVDEPGVCIDTPSAGALSGVQ